jgi:hypothetical protein
MRAILNAILAFIGAEALTDEEFDSVEIEDEDSNEEKYNALLLILDARDGISGMQARLRYYYLAKGITFGSDPGFPNESATGKSNIFVGSEL